MVGSMKPQRANAIVRRIAFSILLLLCGSPWPTRSTAEDVCDRFLSNEPIPPAAPVQGRIPDTAAEYWNSRNKYLMVISATKSAVPEGDLSDMKLYDVPIISKLNQYGYVLKTQLTAEQATRENVTNELQSITAGSNDIVVIYFIGHSVGSGDNLHLQLFDPGQTILGVGKGIKLTDVIENVRLSYEGELVIILDTCFSGTATALNLPLKYLTNTIIITSSDFNEESAITENPKESLFSSMLSRGLNERWELVDRDQDGIIDYQELHDYLTNCLQCMFKKHLTPKDMHPKYFLNSEQRIFAYDASKALVWNSPLRDQLTIEAIEIAMVTEIHQREASTFEWPTDGSPIAPPPPDSRVLALTANLPADNKESRYIDTLRLIGKGEYKEAQALAEQSIPSTANPQEKVQLYKALALAQRYQKDSKSALKTYNTAIAELGAKPDLLGEKSYVLYKEGLHKQSQEVFIQATSEKAITLGGQGTPYASVEVIDKSVKEYLNATRPAATAEDSAKISTKIVKESMKLLKTGQIPP